MLCDNNPSWCIFPPPPGMLQDSAWVSEYMPRRAILCRGTLRRAGKEDISERMVLDGEGREPGKKTVGWMVDDDDNGDGGGVW